MPNWPSWWEWLGFAFAVALFGYGCGKLIEQTAAWVDTHVTVEVRP